LAEKQQKQEAKKKESCHEAYGFQIAASAKDESMGGGREGVGSIESPGFEADDVSA